MKRCAYAAAAAAAALAPGTAVAQDADVAPPSRAAGGTIARIATPTRALAAPGGRTLRRLRAATGWSHQPQSLLVLGSAEVDGVQWLKLLLPVRPNGTSGWVLRSRVELSRTPYWITIFRRKRQVRVYRRGHAVHRYRAVVGKPATRTPPGLAAIYEINRQPDPTAFLGTWALPLTILSPELRSFGGGPGRVAIHGRAGLSLRDPLGTARSHGCVRIDNGPVGWIARHVPRGTPVEIRR